LKNNRKILIISAFTIGFSIVGVVFILIVLGFSIFAAGMIINGTSVSELYKGNNLFYLLHLIPVFAGIAGFYTGGFLISKHETYQEKIMVLRNTINGTINFAKGIEKGNLLSRYIPVNGESELTDSLESMRLSLLKANQVDFERNTIAKIVSDINLILRSINEIDRLGEEITSYLVTKLENVVQGAFYIVGESENGKKVIYLKTSYAYKRKKYLKAEFEFAEGLIGQAAIEKDIILRTEIPDNYVTISSGLMGDKKPKSILIVPLIANDTVHGVLELASIQKFSELQVKILSGIGEIIARTINNVLVNERTRLLLKESEQMSSELVIQKGKLLQNAKDMIFAQEQLKKSNVQLEEQIREVHNSNKKTHVLLENSLEVIFIFSESGMTLYVSPSVRSVLGYFPEEIIGMKDVDNIHPLDTNNFRNFIQNIISYPEKNHILQYRYFTKKGDILWLEAIGKNSLADVIRGIVINTRDISEQRLAAKEQRIRAKMQALSENSLDLILRIDIFSRCTYINPVIESYTGMKIADLIDKPIMSIGIEESVITLWKKMLDEVGVSKEKRIDEVVFPTSQGNKIMQVSAIPEFQDNGVVESVLFVCHDITLSKNREELIRKKNKSINDSINYAYYIQSALMPTEKTLQSIIPNSFMFYKPKDIVSGDYPWIFKDGDIVYIGVMDCTGHGVPGALMSIIGFFLQNEIIRKNCVDNAGVILDKLHINLVKTLRQEEENSKINDGMDAAFCTIDLKNKVLNYAGAHRGLYYVNKKELTEIRGDRFPVGSSQYSNRKPFTNHVINIEPGDAFYFMTDGFADQLGGPTGKQKFMSGNVSLLIKDNCNQSIFQQGNLFRNTFESWKGAFEQVDDILVIGLKF
jgi:PAS domain S-box-containing protein